MRRIRTPDYKRVLSTRIWDGASGERGGEYGCVVASYRFLSISLVSISIAINLQACGMLAPHYDFETEIADCTSTAKVSTILEGQFLSPSKQIMKFERGDKAKLVYEFKVRALHRGRSGIIDNRTGKQLPPSSMLIREDEAPQNAFGKHAIICYESKPQKIHTIHYAK